MVSREPLLPAQQAALGALEPVARVAGRHSPNTIEEARVPCVAEMLTVVVTAQRNVGISQEKLCH